MRMLCLMQIEIGATGDEVKIPIRYGSTHKVVVAHPCKTHALCAIVRNEDVEAARALLLEDLKLKILYDSADSMEGEEQSQTDFRALTLQANDADRDFWRVFSAFRAKDWVITLNYLHPNLSQ